MLDDPDAPKGLRHDLQHSRDAGHAYDVDDKLAALQRALADNAAGASTSSSLAGTKASAAGSKLLGKWLLGSLACGGSIGLVALGFQFSAPAPAEKYPPAAAPAQDITTSAPVPSAPPPSARPQNTAAPHSAARLEISQLLNLRQLQRKDAQAALELAQRSQAQFPNGLFIEERAGLIVLLLDAQGETSRAKAKARVFLEHYPQSTLAASVREVLER